MSELDKLARQIKAARKEYDALVQDLTEARANVAAVEKATQAASQSLYELRRKLVVAADPNSAGGLLGGV